VAERGYRSSSGFGTSLVDGSSFEEIMLDLAGSSRQGTPKFDTVEVQGKGCSLPGKDLRHLALAAWHEAFGLEPPDADELQKLHKMAAQRAADRANLREAMLAELTAGPAGIAQFTARHERDRDKCRARLHA